MLFFQHNMALGPWRREPLACAELKRSYLPTLSKGMLVPQLTYTYAHKFYYLCLSITDIGNFRCTYYLASGYNTYQPSSKSFLSSDESRRVSRADAELVTEKAPFDRWCTVTTPRFY
jgi:hypothetical protein